MGKIEPEHNAPAEPEMRLRHILVAELIVRQEKRMTTPQTISIAIVVAAILLIAVGCSRKTGTATPAAETGFRGGFNGDFWSDDAIRKRWEVFAKAGPSLALPAKRYTCSSPIRSCPGTLYVALYPRGAFENLVDFAIFQFFSSSVQQSLLQSGEIDMEWFVPQSADEGAASVRNWLNHAMEFPDGGDMKEAITQLSLPADLDWITALEFTSWSYSKAGGSLEVIAETPNGYLTMFTIED